MCLLTGYRPFDISLKNEDEYLVNDQDIDHYDEEPVSVPCSYAPQNIRLLLFYKLCDIYQWNHIKFVYNVSMLYTFVCVWFYTLVSSGYVDTLSIRPRDIIPTQWTSTFVPFYYPYALKWSHNLQARAGLVKGMNQSAIVRAILYYAVFVLSMVHLY